MSGPEEPADGDDGVSTGTTDDLATAITAAYKVLGETDAADGVGVIGRATTTSGTPIGVQGLVPNSTGGWGLATPHDVKIEGVVDTNGTDFVAEAGTLETIDAQNVVLGHGSNTATSGVVGAVVGGGGFDDGIQDDSNLVENDYGTIAGGLDNTIRGDEATIAGGEGNRADAQQAAIGGGGNNRVGRRSGTIAGGSNNDIYDTGYEAAIGGGDYNEVTGDRGTIGGGSNNVAEGKYGTISGGGPTDDSNALTTNNVVYDDYGTIGGGGNNQAGAVGSTTAAYATVSGGEKNVASSDNATVGGGTGNVADGTDATVAGGRENEASGRQSTVVGGINNVASAPNSVVAGRAAVAEDRDSFVYNDNTLYHDTDGDTTDDGFSSAQNVAGSGVTGPETFHASAQGGFRFVTGASSVTYISGGSTGWATTSTRAAKTDFRPVDPESVLDGVARMEIETWEYRDTEGEGRGERHLGPTAEQFHDELPVDVGDSDRHLNSINVDGVALAAIQGLADRAEDRADRIEQLEAELARKDERIADLERRIEAVERGSEGGSGDAAGAAGDD